MVHGVWGFLFWIHRNAKRYGALLNENDAGSKTRKF